jgi:glutathione S-transferase
VIPPDDPAMKAEMLLLSSSMLVPSLQHGGVKVWDTLAIGEYLNEIKPKAGLLPADVGARAHCRAICGEMHSGLRLHARRAADEHQGPFPQLQGVVARAGRHRPHRWRSGGVPRPLRRALPVRQAAVHGRRDVRAGGHALSHYDVALDKACAAYCKRIMELPAMKEWVAAAKKEPDEIDELDAEF